ncbi:zinc finger BED domain-containing protein 4-like [Gouania willdenowi]|uniref:zinc finger BED domain-containing protein 4-like n=1 Tax=Gouania willdenowi TaxID=441366 RepID=UPI001054C0BF|nr:zinc finger BED domain-containing protein 4-like [Gouania willdenowi]
MCLEAEDQAPARKKQTNISDFVCKKKILTQQQCAPLTDNVLNMLVKDMRPLSMVEGAGFQQMLKSFNPGYTIPSRMHFARLLDKKYNATVDQVKSRISAIDSKVALTADIWTSVATGRYMGITCHYIGIDWQMESICLSTMPLEERHTAQNIAGWLQEILDKFEILPDKISAIVHDQHRGCCSTTTVGPLSDAQVTHCSLFSPLLLNTRSLPKQLELHDALLSILKEVNLLGQKQHQMGTPEHELIQDVSARWNSTYHMINRLLE